MELVFLIGRSELFGVFDHLLRGIAYFQVVLIPEYVETSSQKFDEEHDEDCHQRNTLSPVVVCDRACQTWRAQRVSSGCKQLGLVSCLVTWWLLEIEQDITFCLCGSTIAPAQMDRKIADYLHV